MDIHVFRYLDKPINKKRLYSGLDYAIKRLTDISGKITFEIHSKFITLSKKDIICAEAQLRNVNIYTPTEMYTSKKNMIFWKEQLKNPCFFQPHRSYIVNMNILFLLTKRRFTPIIQLWPYLFHAIHIKVLRQLICYLWKIHDNLS